MNLFNEIYDLTFLPLVTPTSLLDSLKLDNYKTINYFKDGEILLAKVECVVDSKLITFNYEFNKDNYLNCIYFIEDNKREFLFNRDELLESLKTQFNDNLLKKTI